MSHRQGRERELCRRPAANRKQHSPPRQLLQQPTGPLPASTQPLNCPVLPQKQPQPKTATDPAHKGALTDIRGATEALERAEGCTAPPSSALQSTPQQVWAHPSSPSSLISSHCWQLGQAAARAGQQHLGQTSCVQGWGRLFDNRERCIHGTAEATWCHSELCQRRKLTLQELSPGAESSELLLH